MAHAVLHEDENGQLEDVTYYCSDRCARTDGGYAGWYGCVDPSTTEACPSCGTVMEGEDEAYERDRMRARMAL